MSGRPQMTASGGRVFDPAGQFIILSSAIKQGIFGLDETKTVPELHLEETDETLRKTPAPGHSTTGPGR